MGVIICIDLSNDKPNFYDEIEQQIFEIKEKVNENCCIFLVGCKKDI
jgi:hypothetical protein